MDKMRVGVVGAGWVAREHIRAYQKNPHTEVVAICSRRTSSCTALMSQTNLPDGSKGLICNSYTDYDKMLQQENLDIVSICTPNHLHAKETIQAAEKGKHILIEKPVALTLNDLKAMQRAVKENKVKTVVSFVLRWNPLFEIVKSLLADDALGKIFYAEVDYLHNIGSWYTGYDWVRKISTGGSSLLVGGCHAVDALRWFVGKEPIEVCAYSGGYNKDYEYDATIVVILKFEDGLIGKISTSFECKMPYVFNLELFGDKGTIRNNKLYSHKFPGQTNFVEIPTILPDSGDVSHHPFQGEIDHLVDCVINNKESHVNLEDAIKTHEICLAADISAREGKPIKLPLL